MRLAKSPLAALLRGFAAGVGGTAVMTAAQELDSKLQGSGDEPSQEDPQDPWDKAPVPALVAKRIGEGVFHTEVSADLIPLLTNVMHWGYGVTWGGVYGLLPESVKARPVRGGVAFGLAVWSFSYVQLVPMGLYEPPWKYSARELAGEIGYHLAYGAGVGGSHRLLSA
jgi:uncharacterized protein DUF1440